MSRSYTPGENQVRRTSILSHNPTQGIKRLPRSFLKGVQIIDKFLYYINRVDLNQSVLLNLSLRGGQLYKPPFYRRGVQP
jgi:hypothetical protein